MKTNKIILTIIIFLHSIINIYAADKDLQTAGFGFYKGITSVNEEYADPNSAVLIENYDFKEDGLLQARGGWFFYSDLIVDTPIQNLFFYKNASKINYYVASADKDLYTFTYNNYTKLTIPISISDFDNRGLFAQNNLLFIGDGVNQNLKFNGTDIKIAGLIAPTAPADLTSAPDSTSALDTGTYRYKYTFYSDTTGWNLMESTSNIDYAEVTIDTYTAITLSNIQISSNDLTTKRRIWRTKGVETALYYLLAEIDNNIDTIYIDKKNDTELSSVVLNLAQVRDPLPPTNIFSEYKGYNFAAGNQSSPYRLYWSNLYLPEYHNTELDYWDEPDRQEITGLAKSSGHLIIFTKSKTYSLFIPNETFTDFSTWYITLLNGAIGCINNNSISNIGGQDAGIAFVSNQGIYGLGVNLYNNFINNSVSGSNFDYFGLGVRNIYNQYIKRYPTLVKSFFKDHRYYLSYSTNGVYNDRVLIFNTIARSWSEYSGIYVNSFLYDIENDVFLTGSSLDDGKIIQLNGGNLYDGNLAMDYNKIISVNNEIETTYYTNTISINNNDGFRYLGDYYDTYEWGATSSGLLEYYYLSFDIPNTIPLQNISKISINYYYLGSNNNPSPMVNDSTVIWNNITGSWEWSVSSDSVVTPETFLFVTQQNIPIGYTIFDIQSNQFSNFKHGTNWLGTRSVFATDIKGIASTRSATPPSITIEYFDTNTIRNDVITLQNRIISDTNYSDTTLQNFIEHQTAYFFKSNKEYYGMSPITWNDSNSFTVKTKVWGVDTGYYVKTGTKNQIITTPFVNCNSPTIEKLLSFIFIDIFASGGILETFTYFNTNDTYQYNQANVKVYGNNWGDTGLTWGSGLTWGIKGNNQRRKIAFDSLSLFQRVKNKFFINTYEPLIALNQYYLLYQPLRTDYYDW